MTAFKIRCKTTKEWRESLVLTSHQVQPLAFSGKNCGTSYITRKLIKVLTDLPVGTPLNILITGNMQRDVMSSVTSRLQEIAQFAASVNAPIVVRNVNLIIENKNA